MLYQCKSQWTAFETRSSYIQTLTVLTFMVKWIFKAKPWGSQWLQVGWVTNVIKYINQIKTKEDLILRHEGKQYFHTLLRGKKTTGKRNVSTSAGCSRTPGAQCWKMLAIHIGLRVRGSRDNVYRSFFSGKKKFLKVPIWYKEEIW